jgi:hypothetical protein
MSLETLLAMTGGWHSAVLAFGCVELPLWAALRRHGATLGRLFISPLLAVPATLAATVGMAALMPFIPHAGYVATGLMQLAMGMSVCVAIGHCTGRWLARGEVPRAEVKRGTDLAAASGWICGHDPVQSGELSIAGHRLALADETKHFKVIGTTGTGKSTAITQLLEQALARGDRAVVADPDGGYLRRFYDARRGDIILNPFDQRSVRWDPFAEIRNEYDVDQLARSLIPDHEGGDRSWRGYARTFFSAVTRQAHACHVRDPKELFRLLTIADVQELATLTRGTPAQPFLDPSNAKMFHSLRSVTSSAVASLEYVANQQTVPFSIRSWVEQERSAKPGVLFIPYRAGQIAALRSTVSAWMRIAIFSAMDRPEADQRLWFVVDELDALGAIDGLKDALARVRKFGGRCVLGLQSIAQVASTYGEGEARTIVENCGNSLILRCSASDGGGTSRFASTLIGQREVRKTSVSRSQHDTEWFGSVTRAEHFSIEPAVLDSEVEQIPDLCGYLKLAGQPAWRRVRLVPPTPRTGSSIDVAAFVPVPASLPAPAMLPATKPAAATRRRARPRPSAQSAAEAGDTKPASTQTTRARTRRSGKVAGSVSAPQVPEQRGLER